MHMTPEQKAFQEETTKSVVEAVEKALPEVVDSVVTKKVAELSEKNANDLDEVKAELKKMNVSLRETPELKTLANKTAVVSIFKEVLENNVNSEKAFNEIVDKTIKTMTEGTATAGAELVFDQFETDVLRVINTYTIVNDVRILSLVKGDKVSLPKATNGITTYFVAEGVAPTATDGVTAFINIDIAKAATLTDMTQELLEDTMTIPDLYDLIVEFVGESQASFLETQILTGTGSIKGILVDAGVNKIALAATKRASDVVDSNIVDVVFKAAMKFKRGTKKWYMSQYVFGKLTALKTTDGYPLYPSLRDVNPTLMGSAVVISDNAFVQNLAGDVANGVLLMYGDLKYFTLAKRKGLTMERGYYGDNWKKGIISLLSNQRFGGISTYPEAITILTNGAT